MTAKKIVLATLGAVLVAGAAIPAFAAPERPAHGHAGPHHMRPMGHPMGHGMMKDMLFIRLLKNADTNKDGKISKEEMTAYEDTLFTAIDANKDGAITRGELLDYKIAQMEAFRKAHPRPEKADDKDHPDGPRADHKGPDGKGGPHGDFRHARWQHRGPGMGGDRLFRMIDENHDNKITKAEATAAGDKLFAMMDTNKDGVISIDDLPDRPL
ncbi:hypothetical protein [Neorhizobium sp. NCHU2750]|uniref:hypothetical protein n=1 Tax=Neorhizobium sp. NCHU2750 TaxID=1825976 RepID=UPI000E73BE22|nr:hypothetical protein NCHU2750_00630 [Neorhizobium sp. NCHU2750]